jgi:hypothetical protein
MYSDLLDWKGTTIPRSYNKESPSLPSPSNLRRRLEQVNALFCPKLNCVESLCTAHGIAFELGSFFDANSYYNLQLNRIPCRHHVGKP